MSHWKTRLWLQPHGMKLLVRAEEGHDLLKAQILDQPAHPRALLTLLEGLALWSGERLVVAIHAGGPLSDSFGLGPFADFDQGWPAASPLIQYEFPAPMPRGRRMRGDFRQLPLLSPAWRQR